MSIALCRVDDRLIHGQVVLGWGAPLRADLIVVVDDTVSANPWEQEIYRMAVPPELEVEFLSEPAAASRLREWSSSGQKVILLTGDVATMVALVDDSDGLLTRINLGGVHQQPGRSERLRYLFLSEGEISQLRRLEAAGARVTAQDLPTAAPVPLRELLE